MKLLFDQNLSPKLVLHFDGHFEEVRHVSDLNLDKVKDIEVLQYAKSNNFTIVTKGSDFGDFVSILGFPPKIIWIRIGNCTTTDIINILKKNIDKVHKFDSDDINGILNLI